MRTSMLVCFFAAACAALSAQTTTKMYPDPHVAGPDIYRTVLENDSVRIYEVTFKPGARIKPHSHPDHVAYIVSGGTLRVTQPGQAPQMFQLKTGEAAFLPAQSHEAENTGMTEVKLATVELRKSGMAAPAGTEPHKAGPKIYRSVFENERVRVFEVTFDKGAKIASHSHPDHAVYVLEGGKLRITVPGQAPQDMELKAGEAAFLPAQAHTAQNLGDSRVRVIVYELKPMMMSKS
jgi:beta-alanine degradation protein BauB